MRVTGRIVGANIGYKSRKPTIQLEVNEQKDFEQLVDEMGDLEKVTIEISKFRERRSLDANAYAWVLMGKLASVLNKPKTEIYREYIKDVGDNFTVACVKTEAVDRLIAGWQKNGLGWVTETQESKLSGCANVFLYYGSSTYDTHAMSRLLDMIIFDCRENGINTDTPEQIAEMLARWGEA